MCLIDGNCSEEPGICHENSSCSLVSPEVCASERPISYKCVCNQGYNGDGSDCQGQITVKVAAHNILHLLTLFLTLFVLACHAHARHADADSEAAGGTKMHCGYADGQAANISIRFDSYLPMISAYQRSSVFARCARVYVLVRLGLCLLTTSYYS